MIRLHTQKTTKADKKNIKQATKFKYPADAQKAKWKFIGSGGYKKVYKKGKIVVKFPIYDDYGRWSKGSSISHIIGEAKAYFKLKKRERRYFARIFGYDKHKSIQRFTPEIKIKRNGKKWYKCFEVIEKFKLWDAYPGGNMTYFEDRPVVYDFGPDV